LLRAVYRNSTKKLVLPWTSGPRLSRFEDTTPEKYGHQQQHETKKTLKHHWLLITENNPPHIIPLMPPPGGAAAALDESGRNAPS
jgi:hypothetical protein